MEKWTLFPTCGIRSLKHNLYLDQKKKTEIVGEDFAHMDKERKQRVIFLMKTKQMKKILICMTWFCCSINSFVVFDTF